MDIEQPEFVLFLKCAGLNQLRYLCIGGYAVNFYGFHRATEDMDIWIAPTNENKICFLNTLHCLGYTPSETDEIKNEEFTKPFICSIGAMPHVIDILTFVHKKISFDEAEKERLTHKISNETALHMVPYNFLKDIKLRSARPKDLLDVAQLEELRNK